MLFLDWNRLVSVNDANRREELIEFLLVKVFPYKLLIVTIIEIENLSVVCQSFLVHRYELAHELCRLVNEEYWLIGRTLPKHFPLQLPHIGVECELYII